MSDSITNEENLTNKDAHIEHTQHTSNYSTESLEKQGKSSNLVYFSIGKNIKDKSVKNEECEWQEFKDALINPQKYTVRYNHFKTDEKTGKFLQEKDTGKYIELSHDEAVLQIISREKKKMRYFVGGHFNPAERNNKNLQFRSLLVLDIDKYKSSIDELESLLDKELSQYDYVAYSTASHTPRTPCIRVVIRCEKQIPTKEYKKVVTNFIEGFSFKECIDIASATASQAMYLPAIIEITEQPEGQEYSYEYWNKKNTGSGIDYNNFVSKSKKSAKSLSINSVNKHKFHQNKIPQLLAKYPASDLEYQQWLEVGMALHHYYEGQQEGLTLWDSWSALHKEKYEPEKIKAKYASFKDKKDLDNPITIETIARRASELNIKKIDDVIFRKMIGGHDFVLTKDTLYAIVEKKDENGIKQEVPIRISDYIELKGQGTSSNGQYCFVMSILDRENNIKDIFLPLNAKNDILKQYLLDAGLVFNPKHFLVLVNYILANKTNINVNIEYKLGWNDDLSCYNLMSQQGLQSYYRKRVGYHQQNVLEFIMKNNELLHKKGSLEEWQDNVAKYAQNNSNLLFTLYASFAPIFFNPLNRKGIILHFFGKSSIGKSIMLSMAGSVWGHSGEGYLQWEGTSNGIENLGLQKNDALLCLDELTGLKGKETISTVPYRLINGQSKNRADSRGERFGNRASKTWKTLVLSTGEETFLAKMSGIDEEIKGGQTVRFIDIPVFLSEELGIFDCLHEAVTPKYLAEKIYDNCANYKGAAIEAFLKYVFVDNDFDAILKKVSEEKEVWFKQNMPSGATAQVGRVAEVFSTLAAVGEIFIASGVLPEKYGFVKGQALHNITVIFQRWLEELGDFTTSAEVKVIREKLRKFFFKHHANDFYIKEKHGDGVYIQDTQSEFPQRPPYQNTCVGMMLSSSHGKGKKYSAVETREYYVFKDVMEDEALKGSNSRDAINIMRENNFITPEAEKKIDGTSAIRNTYRIYYPRDKKSHRFYKLNLEGLDISVDDLALAKDLTTEEKKKDVAKSSSGFAKGENDNVPPSISDNQCDSREVSISEEEHYKSVKNIPLP